MINRLRTLSARILTRFFCRPRALIISAWFWLAAQTDELEVKRRCLEAILELDPGLEWAQMALRDVQDRRARTK